MERQQNCWVVGTFSLWFLILLWESFAKTRSLVPSGIDRVLLLAMCSGVVEIRVGWGEVRVLLCGLAYALV
jgi:hypothetical protein